MQLDEGELGRVVDGDEHVKLSLLGADFGDVDVDVADWVGLEAFLGGLLAIGVGQAGDAMALQAAMQ